ncbi:MAG: DUF1579 family protein [Planctomycetes bacterium]|nr:DUF1579 family protein [Planctomycetota bacterium]
MFDHPSRALCASALFAFAVATPFARAQDEMAAPQPAAELSKLAAFVGNWEGSGEANFSPGQPPTKWKGHGTHRWSHDGHFLQEDFVLRFEGLPIPLVMRSYFGWDRERGRYAMIQVQNNGRAVLRDFAIQPDGAIYQMLLQHQEGVDYAERSLMRLDGQKLVHSIDLFLPEGDSTRVVDAVFTRSEKACEVPLETPPFPGNVPHDAMKKLARLHGTYAVKGTMTMAPGMPPMKISGADVFHTIFGGVAMIAHTDGAAEGMPGKYVSDGFFGYDEARGCLVMAAVSNMGEIMQLEYRFAEGDRALIGMMAGVYSGAPTAMRYVMELDEQGALVRGSGHTLSGTAAPFESFAATYTKK